MESLIAAAARALEAELDQSAGSDDASGGPMMADYLRFGADGVSIAFAHSNTASTKGETGSRSTATRPTLCSTTGLVTGTARMSDMGPSTSRDALPRDQLREDGVHFTPAGYAILAERILPQVLAALGR